MIYDKIRLKSLKDFVVKHEKALACLGTVDRTDDNLIGYKYKGVDDYPYVATILESAGPHCSNIYTEVFYKDTSGRIGSSRLTDYHSLRAGEILGTLVDSISGLIDRTMEAMTVVYPACLKIIQEKFPWLDSAVAVDFNTYGPFKLTAVYQGGEHREQMIITLRPKNGNTFNDVADVVMENIEFGKLHEDEMVSLARGYIFKKRLEAL